MSRTQSRWGWGRWLVGGDGVAGMVCFEVRGGGWALLCEGVGGRNVAPPVVSERRERGHAEG